MVAGCSHPGIEKMLEAARAVAEQVVCIFGGLHLVLTPEPEIQRIAVALRDQWHVQRIAPGHCTGEPAFAALRDAFGERYVFAGLGETIELS
jgi:7,8-dihydropterin-6-yl-methyl-4-(beta-D-ribofuranosyl)aminobenzene 5'-phosphate synthase